MELIPIHHDKPTNEKTKNDVFMYKSFARCGLDCSDEREYIGHTLDNYKYNDVASLFSEMLLLHVTSWYRRKHKSTFLTNYNGHPRKIPRYEFTLANDPNLYTLKATNAIRDGFYEKWHQIIQLRFSLYRKAFDVEYNCHLGNKEYLDFEPYDGKMNSTDIKNYLMSLEVPQRIATILTFTPHHMFDSGK